MIDERAFELAVERATRRALTEVLVPVLQQDRPELDELVSVSTVASMLDCGRDHVARLIDDGELGEVFDIRGPGSGRAVRRVSRLAVAEYIGRSRTGAVARARLAVAR